MDLPPFCLICAQSRIGQDSLTNVTYDDLVFGTLLSRLLPEILWGCLLGQPALFEGLGADAGEVFLDMMRYLVR